MSVEVLFFSMLLAFSLLRFGIQPRVVNSLNSGADGKSPSSVTIARLSATKLLGTTAMLLAIGSGIGMGLQAYVESLNIEYIGQENFITALKDVQDALEKVGQFKNLLPYVDASIALLVLIFCVLVLFYWTVTRTESVNARLNDELSRLREALKRNELDDLPPTERMNEVRELIDRAIANNEDLEKVEALYELLLDVDLLRRVDPKLLDEANIPRFTSSPLKRLIEILISRTIFSGLAFLGSATAAATMVVMVLASLGFVSADINDSAKKVYAQLEDYKRKISLNIVKEETNLELNNKILINQGTSLPLPKPPPPCSTNSADQLLTGSVETSCQKSQDSKEERLIAAYFGSIFDIAWTAIHSSDKQGEQFKGRHSVSNDLRDGFNEARRDWARRAVLIKAAESNAAIVVESASNDESRVARTILDILLSARVKGEPATAVGRAAEKVVLQVAALNREAFGKIATAVRNYQTSDPVAKSPPSGTVSNRLFDTTPLELGEAIAKLTYLLPQIAGGEVSLTDNNSDLTIELAKKIIEEVTTTVGEDVFMKIATEPDNKRIEDAAAAKAIVNLLNGKGIADTVEQVKEIFGPIRGSKYERAVVALTNTTFGDMKGVSGDWEVALHVPLDTEIDQSRARESVHQMRQLQGVLKIDALSTYQSLFPGVEGQVARSFQASVVRAIDSEIAQKLFGPEQYSIVEGNPRTVKPPKGQTIHLRPSLTYKSAPAVSRARSYRALRGFARIGGVLIGRAANSPGTLDIRHLSYTRDPDHPTRLRIRVVQSSGDSVILGPYDPAIAHLALAYAADGRPTTVTMIDTPPMWNLKILLHPTLVDTGLGCRAIQLDRFVDNSLSYDESARLNRDRIVDQANVSFHLYKLAWANRFDALDNHFGHSLQERYKVAFENYNRRLEDLGELDDISPYRRSKEFYQDIKKSVLFKSNKSYSELIVDIERMFEIAPESATNYDVGLAPPKPNKEDKAALTLLRARNSYYDETLVNMMDACALAGFKSHGEDDFLACIRDKATSRENLTHLKGNQNLFWILPPPNVAFVSGVRERAFDLDSELEFAKPPKTTASVPFRFIYQIAIKSPVHFAALDEEDNARKDEPWELTDIEESIQEAVEKYVSTNQTATDVLSHMAEFTVLQRLFRAAFDGKLGDQFPVEQLVRLARETANYVNRDNIRTLRWNSYSINAEALVDDYLDRVLKKELKNLQSGVVNILRHRFQPCFDFLKNFAVAEPSVADKLITKELHTCDLSRFEFGTAKKINSIKNINYHLKVLIEKLKLRHALAVPTYELQTKEEYVCPIP